MKKWALACFSILSLMFTTKEVDTNVCVLESEIVGGKYGLYVDEKCETPYEDEEGKPYVLEIVKEKQTITLGEEKIYAKQIKAIDGYYLDDTVYALNGKVVFSSDPICITIDADVYPMEIEVIGDAGEVFTNVLLQEETKIERLGNIEKEYTIHVKNKTAYTFYSDVSFKIPKTKPKEDPVIHLKQETFGTMCVQVHDQENTIVKNGKYALFLNGQQVNDIYGNSTEKELDEAGQLTWDMPEGTYDLQQLSIEDEYYLDSSNTILTCKKQETLSYAREEKKILFCVEIVSEESKERLPGKIQYRDITIDSGMIVALKRGEIVSFVDVEHPNGFYKAEAQTYKVQDTFDGNSSIQLNAVPLTVTFYAKDVDTGKGINGLYQVLDENQQIVFEAEMKNGVFSTNFLHDETVYILREIRCMDGYQHSTDLSFIITKSQYEFALNKIPFVYVSQSITSDVGVVQGTIGLYEDENCTIRVKDISGNAIESLQNTRVRTGNYFMKLESLDSHFYIDTSIQKVKLEQTDSLYKTLKKHVIPVTMNITLKTENGEEVNGYTFEIQNAGGESLGEFSDFQIVEQANEILERQKQYSVRITHIDGLYTYDKSPKMISFLEQSELEIPCVEFICDPYVNFKVLGNAEYGIYEDERCTVLSKDIFGRFTKKSGKSEWLLRTGTYWLKETSAAVGCYENGQIYKIQLEKDIWDVRTKMDALPICLRVLLVDEEGQEIQGSKFEVQDENHEVLQVLTSSSDLQGTFMKPSMKLIFHELQIPEEFESHQTDIVYTLPDQMPSSSPVLKIQCQKKNTAKEIDKEKTIKEIENVTEAHSWKILYIIGGCAFVGFLYLKYRKHI